MKSFPDESQMERSEDGSEPIRGGSIGLNRILNGFVDIATKDSKPRFTAVLISAFTIFRNVWTMQNNPTMSSLEEGFVKDVNLFLEYYDTYLSFVWNGLPADRYCPVIIYFPDYKHLPKELRMETSGKRELLFNLYRDFLARHGNHNGEVKKLEHSRCFWITAGQSSYPHKDVASKFREITAHPQIAYYIGDPVCLISHIPLDLYMSARIRKLVLLESYTGRIRTPPEFRIKIDKEGRVPFTSAAHVALGDSVLIKPMANLKQRKAIYEAAEKDRWLTRGEEDIRNRIAKIMDVSSNTLRKYDFI